jgi:uncharacterized protein (DUF885 family)
MTLRPLPLALALAFAAPLALLPSTTTAQEAATATAPTKAQQLEAMYAEYWEDLMRTFPTYATSVGDPRYNHLLPNVYTEARRKEESEFNHRWLARAEAIGPDGLEGAARLSYDIFVRDLRNEIEGERFPDWMQPLNQFRNVAGSFAQLGSGTGAQPFKTVKDYDDWLQRAARIPELFKSMQDDIRTGIAKGVVQPRVLMVKVDSQLEKLISDDPTKTIFWGPIERMPESFAAADKARLTAAFRSLIEKDLMPAYRDLRRFVNDEYLPKTRTTVSLADLPDGQAWYAYRARMSTTTDLTPAQIHDIGLREVERIHGEMRAVMAQVGFEGTLQDFFKHLQTDKKFEFATEEALLKDYRALEARVNAGVPKLFSLTPKAAFEIRPVEAFRNQSAAGGSYQRPSQDGSRPGIFYVNTYDLPTRKTWDAESLFLHEAIPGHHFQLALQQELTGLPMFRRFGGETAFSEGWGLYAESLGKELGVYTDPYQYFGRLQAELWRAIRLVVDTGLHSKGWTREQVIAYMLENSAESETSSISETERYIAIPGQALAYKIGELKILELRARAEKALGAKFDIREFHAEVLKDGSIPLEALEAKIDRWIAEKQAG